MDPLRVVLLESMEYKFSDGISIQVEKSTPTEMEAHQKVIQQRSVDEANLMSDNISRNLQKERQLLQEKMYASWLNYRLKQAPGSPQITNLFEDLRDGKLLLALLELLTGQSLKAGNGKMRVHHLTNLSKAFKVLTEEGIKTVGISTENICDGNITSTLGLCWHVIYHFQVLSCVMDDDQKEGGSAEKALLEWCREIAQSYAASDVKSFKPSFWKTGYMLNAIIHSFNPKLFQFHTLTQLSDAGRVQHALDLADNHYQVPQLFSTTDFEQNLIDNKTLVLYVSMLREKMISHINSEKEVMEKLQGELGELKKAVEEKENCDLINPPSNLTFSESKKFSSHYKEFDKSLDDLSDRLVQMKEEGKSADCVETIDQFNTDCDDLQKRVNDLKENSKICNGDVKERRIKVVKDTLDHVKQSVDNVKTQLEEVSASITPYSSKEDLQKCEVSCKDLIHTLKQMQSLVKGACTLVDEAYSDKSLPKAVRQELKNDAIEVLDKYAKLMGGLEAQQKKSNSLLTDKAKGIDDKFASWSSRVKDLDVWLAERTNKFENMLIEYGTLGHLKEVSSQNKQLIKDIGEAWKRFELLAAEWNKELCDQLNDDKYADVLTDIQIKFNKLNEVATKTKSLISGMVHQKRAENVVSANLLTLKTYADSKEVEINTGPDALKLEELTKEIDTKESDVKVFLKNSSDVLKKNKYDENAVKQLETDLKVFCDQWDRIKDACKDKKMKANHLEQTQAIQRETERNLVESLSDWQKVLDEYVSRLNDCEIGDTCNLHDLSKAIEDLQTLVGEIDGHDGKIKEYDHNSTTLINTLEDEKASSLIVDFQLFFKNWDELKGKSHSLLDRLKEQHEKLLSNEDSIMGEWRNKHMVTEEWLDNVAQEISVYAEPEMDFDEFDDYFAKLDELENKVNAESESIELGKNLAEGDQLILDHNKEKVKDVVDAFKQKQSHIHDNLLLAKRKMGDLKEKKRLQKEKENELAAQMAEWNKILQDNTDTLNRCNVTEICDLTDTHKAVDILEALLAEISANDDKLSEFDTNSQDILSLFPADKAASFNMDFQLFHKSWDHCKDKATERLAGLKMQFGQLQKNEEYMMSEWDSNALKTLAWLEDVESEAASYCALPDDLDDIQAFVSNYEELVNKVDTKEGSIIEQKVHGNGLIESGKIQQHDHVERIQGNVATFEEKLDAVKETLNDAKKLIENQVRGIILKKLEDFQTWLPTVQKRSEEGDEIGPDFETVNKQIQEMKVIEGQTLQMSFNGVLEDEKLFAFLSDEDKEILKKANDEWDTIKAWVDKRLEILAKTENFWDEFKARKVDLVEYLRDVENELNAASGLDLNDSSTVEARTEAFKNVTAGMETRKYHVANLVEISDQLIDLISSESGSESSLASGIQSQVTDILDLWNSRVKRSIELKTILQASCKRFEELEKVFSEVHEWISNVNDMLNQFTVDARGEHIDELRVSLEEKQKQEDEMRDKLTEVNAIDEELSKNGEITSQYSLEGSITELNEDFNAVATQLEQLRKFRGKARILSRRVRGGTRRLFTKGDRPEEVAPQPIEAAS